TPGRKLSDMAKKPLGEQVVVVTGASAGLGRAIARVAAARGARVVVAARGDGVDAAVAELGANAVGVQADVASLDDCQRIVEAAVDTFVHPVRELPIGWGAQKLLWGQKLSPRAGDLLLLRNGWKGQHTGEDKPVGSPDNLFEPLPGDHGARGRFTARSRPTTAWTSLRLRRW